VKRRTKVASMLLLVGLFAFDASPCWACSCAVRPPGPADSSDVVFTGKVLDVRRGWGFNERTAQRIILSPSGLPFFGEAVFQVQTVYKGYVRRTQVIAGAGAEASCGFEFESGKIYTVFADYRYGYLETGLCDGTVEGTIDPSKYGLPLEPPDEEFSRASIAEGSGDNQPYGYTRWILLVFAATTAVTGGVVIRFAWIAMRKLLRRFSR